MRIFKEQFEKDGAGFVTLKIDEAEDLWHLYNLVAPGDLVTSTAMRKVQRAGAVGSSTATDRVRMTLQIGVEKIDYDASTSSLRLSGKIVADPHSQYVKTGQYHTFEFGEQSQLTIAKAAWDAMHVERLRESSDVSARADMAAVLLQEGLAHVCLVTAHMTLCRQRIEMHIPRKRRVVAGGHQPQHQPQHEKVLDKFFEAVARAMTQHIRWDVVKCVLIASPGFVKDQFLRFIDTKFPAKELAVYKDRFILCKTSSGHKGALQEVLHDPDIARRVGDTKASAEVRALHDFQMMLQTEPSRAFYGFKHIRAAVDAGAIQTLLVADELFRHSKDVAVRRRHVQLIEDTRAQGGAVFVLSSMHVSGEQLKQIGGIAAILRYPMPELEDMLVEDGEDLYPAPGAGVAAKAEEELAPEQAAMGALSLHSRHGGQAVSAGKILPGDESTVEYAVEYEDELSDTNTDDMLSDREDDFHSDDGL